MRVKVLRGSVVYKGDEYEVGKEFECDKNVVESLLKGNLVEEVKPAPKAKAKKGE